MRVQGKYLHGFETSFPNFYENNSLKPFSNLVQTLKTTIHIGGNQELLYWLMSSFISEHTGARCEVVGESGGLADLYRVKDRPGIFLWDYKSPGAEIVEEIFLAPCPERKKTLTILFNVDKEADSQEILAKGFHGAFQEQETPEMFIKGLSMIDRGELWYSRLVLSRAARTVARPKTVCKAEPVRLTRREKEVLLALAAGESNDAIADSLCISFHTVKTHIYNIYRKIGVTNRIQASDWLKERHQT